MAAVPADHVTVRMYRGILGDCFLVKTCLQGRTRHALIDCGVLQNVKAGEQWLASLPPDVVQSIGREKLAAVEAGPQRIRRIAEDVLETTGNHIDLVVITHEHYDHLSGFQFAQDLFQSSGVVIDQLWMAWTDDPNDAQAQTLQARFGKGRHALAMAVAAQAAFAASDQPRLQAVAADARLQAAVDLAAFIGPAPAFAAAGIMSTRAMIDIMRTKVGSQNMRYLAPGAVIAAGDGIGLTTYVLGPPRDETLLRKDSPSAGAAKEVYLTRPDEADAVTSALMTLLGSAPGGLGADSLASSGRALLPASRSGAPLPAADPPPFARPHRRGMEVTAKDDPRLPLKQLYDREPGRSIDLEWAGVAESLALKMDSDTNNTSLALAMELPGGQVLLFPGDAQVGNWLSWRNQTYPATPEAGQSAVTIDDLLGRVVFYKVGHHGSHNATLKEFGLKKMTSARLTAAIPVVEAVAAVQGKGRENPGRGWQMPYGALYADLQVHTKGRIVRGDGDAAEEVAAFEREKTHAQHPVTVLHDPKGLWVELAFPVISAE